MLINNLPLPEDLLLLMESGRWPGPADAALVNRLFPENGGLRLYSLSLMQSETEWARRPQLRGPMWLGMPDADNPPGDLDPAQAVLIADLGHGFDQPIALDYRESRQRPRVVTLQWSEGGARNRWVVVAPDVLSFASLVGVT